MATRFYINKERVSEEMYNEQVRRNNELVELMDKDFSAFLKVADEANFCMAF